MHFIIEASFVSGFRIESISMEVKSPERRGRMGEVQQIGCSPFYAVSGVIRKRERREGGKSSESR